MPPDAVAAGAGVQVLPRLPPAACNIVARDASVPATSEVLVKHAAPRVPHAVKVSSRTSPD
jgi:hypothetical protein